MLGELVLIPAGSFTLGHPTHPDASPQHRLDLPAYSIGKYPVTNEEYAEFITAGGYRTEEYWTQMGWRWLQSRPQTEPGFWKDPRFNSQRQPVVGVSWYEAVAFCNWLTANYSSIQRGKEGRGRGFRLPSEAEWEKAARGALDARVYPWGDTYKPNCANTAELGMGRTTAIDAFPRGASPYAVHDLAGNAYEWTLSKWGMNWQELEFVYPYHPADGREEIQGSAARVMRGGSWFNPIVEAQVWLRARFLPGSRGSNIGFRVAQSI